MKKKRARIIYPVLYVGVGFQCDTDEEMRPCMLQVIPLRRNKKQYAKLLTRAIEEIVMMLEGIATP